jgi:hypothetical protein
VNTRRVRRPPFLAMLAIVSAFRELSTKAGQAQSGALRDKDFGGWAHFTRANLDEMKRLTSSLAWYPLPGPQDVQRGQSRKNWEVSHGVYWPRRPQE